MENIKIGDIVVRGSDKRKVLAVLEEIVFLSEPNAFEKAGLYLTLEELKEENYTIQESKWEPIEDENYWWISGDGFIGQSFWRNNKTDNKYRNFLGVYETQQKAEEALLEIRKKLK